MMDLLQRSVNALYDNRS